MLFFSIKANMTKVSHELNLRNVFKLMESYLRKLVYSRKQQKRTKRLFAMKMKLDSKEIVLHFWIFTDKSLTSNSHSVPLLLAKQNLKTEKSICCWKQSRCCNLRMLPPSMPVDPLPGTWRRDTLTKPTKCHPWPTLAHLFVFPALMLS